VSRISPPWHSNIHQSGREYKEREIERDKERKGKEGEIPSNSSQNFHHQKDNREINQKRHFK
jgi:hypothetical protein